MKPHTPHPSEEERYRRIMDLLAPGTEAYDRLLREGRAPSQQRRLSSTLPPRLRWAAAAGLVGVALGLSLWFGTRGPQSAPQAEQQPVAVVTPAAAPAPTPPRNESPQEAAQTAPTVQPAPTTRRRPTAPSSPQPATDPLAAPDLDSPAYHEAYALLTRELQEYQMEQEIRQTAHDIEQRGLTAEDLLSNTPSQIITL